MSPVTLLVTLLAAVAPALDEFPQTQPAELAAATAPVAPPSVELLRVWDAQRAGAWARGDPRMLRRLYTPGSAAGRHDRAMLRAWADRGLVVRGLRTQLLSVDVLRRTSSTWTLLVTDRLVGGTAVGAGVRRALPRDEPTTRRVTLRSVAGEWRVASVRPSGS